jgi:hypothetical protein
MSKLRTFHDPSQAANKSQTEYCIGSPLAWNSSPVTPAFRILMSSDHDVVVAIEGVANKNKTRCDFFCAAANRGHCAFAFLVAGGKGVPAALIDRCALV